MASSDPAIDALAGQLDELDAALKRVSTDATKAKVSVGDLGRTAGTAVDPQVHALAQHLVGLDYSVAAVSLHAPQMAVAVERAGAAASGSAAKTKTFQDSLKDAATTFNEVRAAAGTVATAVEAFATRVASLASEQDHLSRLQRQLHLDFDQAAAAAGRFSDETEAAGAAGRFAASDILLTQRQLDALTRVAGAASQELGITTAQAVEQLSEGLISGSERGLRPYGSALANVAGGSHTVAERLAALVRRAGEVRPAVDNATDAMERFKDAIEDGQRTMATAFVTELQRLSQVTADTRAASDATESWADHLQELGRTAAFVGTWIASSFNLAFEAVRFAARTIGGEVAMLAAMAANPLQARSIRAAHESESGERRADLDEAYRRHAALTLDAGRDRTSAAAEAPASDMVFTLDDVASERRSQNALNRREGGGGNASNTHHVIRTEIAKANALALQRLQRLNALLGGDATADAGGDSLEAHLRGIFGPGRGQVTVPGERPRGTISERTEQAGLRAQSGLADVAAGNVGTDRSESQARIAVLREQREALAALNEEATAALDNARARGAPESEINELLRTRLGVQTALTQSTTDLAAATAENSKYLTDFKDRMGAVAEGMVGGFTDAIFAAIEGTKSFADALKDMLHSSMKSLAQLAVMEALKNGALALGNLAMQNYVGAANAGLAAAAWAGVALVAGGIAVATAKPSAGAARSSAGSSTGSSSSARPDASARPDRNGGGPLNLTFVVSGAIFETRHEVLQGIARGVTDARAHGYLAPGAAFD